VGSKYSITHLFKKMCTSWSAVCMPILSKEPAAQSFWTSGNVGAAEKKSCSVPGYLI